MPSCFVPGIMHEHNVQYCNFLYPFGPPAVPAICLTEQQVSLEENGMYFCDCANGKCQQLGSIFVKKIS